MTPTEVIRWMWTFLTGWGVLFALWNLKEVLIDNWAIAQVVTTHRRPLDVLKLQTRSAVNDHALILGALLADFLAGGLAILGISVGALIALIISALALIALSFTQTRQRRRIFRAIQLRPPKEGE